jgi:predicted enzyme related to lactoylglutathione lyase
MAIDLLGLRSVIYPAPDLAAAKAWWAGLLGTAPYFDQPFYVGFNVGGYELGLLPNGNEADGAVAYWGVDDIAAAVDAAVSEGATVRSPVSDVGDGILTASVVTPTGAIAGFIFNPHFTIA